MRTQTVASQYTMSGVLLEDHLNAKDQQSMVNYRMEEEVKV